MVGSLVHWCLSSGFYQLPLLLLTAIAHRKQPTAYSLLKLLRSPSSLKGVFFYWWIVGRKYQTNASLLSI